jgi:hypothetical protein
MTSPAMTALHSVGITHSIMILGVLFIAVAVVIGMYWHIILPGAMMLGVAFLFFSPDGTQTASVEQKVGNSVAAPVEFDERQAYMKDCMEVAEYPMHKCVSLWEHREDAEPVVTKTKVDKVDVSELQLIDVDNAEYKARRAEALQKPNAVIGRVTYR